MGEVFRLAAHVRACIDVDTLVFLDLKRDRYFAAPVAAAPAIEGIARSGSGAAQERLASLNLIQHCAGQALPAMAGARPVAECGAGAPATADWKHVAALVLALAFASIVLVTRRLDLLWARSGKRKRRLSLAPDAVLAHAAWFQQMRPWWPARRVCLFDSIALNLYLAILGYRSDLVIGVRTGPFAAHCWVEIDGAVLSDTLEQCAAFTPIARV